MLEWIFYITTLLVSLTVVDRAAGSGLLNSGFQRGFAGVSTQIVSYNWLSQYTNTESFLTACLDGQLGITGYLFLASLGILITVWVSNLYDFKQAIV